MTDEPSHLRAAALPLLGAAAAVVVAVVVTLAFLSWRSGEQHRVLEYRSGKCREGETRSCDDLRSACLKRSGNACWALADVHLGAGAGRDAAEGLRLLGEACTYRHARACLRKARMHLEGAGIPKDAFEARSLLDRGCDLGAHEACALRQTIP